MSREKDWIMVKSRDNLYVIIIKFTKLFIYASIYPRVRSFCLNLNTNACL